MRVKAGDEWVCSAEGVQLEALSQMGSDPKVWKVSEPEVLSTAEHV